MKTEVCKKKNILNFHKKKLRASKKKFGQKKISNIFFYEMDRKNQKKIK